MIGCVAMLLQILVVGRMVMLSLMRVVICLGVVVAGILFFLIFIGSSIATSRAVGQS